MFGNPSGNPQSQNQSSTEPVTNQCFHFNSTNSSQHHSVPTGVPIYGTVDYMQKSHIHDNGFEQYTSITGSIPGCSLEELRTQDHFNMKNKLLPEWKQSLINNILTKNAASKRENQPRRLFSKPERRPEERQFRKVMHPENLKRFLLRREEKPVVSSSNSGSFSSDVNKIVLVSSLVSLLQKHKMSVPENLLDDTDFVSQFFIFLERYKVNLPKENIPKFSLTDVTPLTNQPRGPVVQTQISSANGKKTTKKPFKRFYSKKSNKEKLGKIKAPEKEASAQLKDSKSSSPPVVKSRSNLGEVQEEEEKGEIRSKNGEVQKDQLKNEYGAKKEEENATENPEDRDEGNKILSVGSSEENSSYEEVIRTPRDN